MQMHSEVAEVGLGSGGDSLSDTFVPEALLPEQYFDRWSARASESPEKRLMFAVLLDAVIQLQGRNQKDASEAETWIRDAAEDSPFTFRNICDALRDRARVPGARPPGVARPQSGVRDTVPRSSPPATDITNACDSAAAAAPSTPRYRRLRSHDRSGYACSGARRSTPHAGVRDRSSHVCECARVRIRHGVAGRSSSCGRGNLPRVIGGVQPRRGRHRPC